MSEHKILNERNIMKASIMLLLIGVLIFVFIWVVNGDARTTYTVTNVIERKTENDITYFEFYIDDNGESRILYIAEKELEDFDLTIKAKEVKLTDKDYSRLTNKERIREENIRLNEMRYPNDKF